MADTDQPTIAPDPEQMRRHLEHLFGGFLDGCQDGRIELAWTDAGDGRLRHAALFGTDDLEAVVERAVAENRRPGQNVYVGVALRKPDTPPFGRCRDEDFLALTAFYADLDEEGVAERAKARTKDCPPTAVVVTGRHPHLRAQLLWRQEVPERDPDLCRRQNLALAESLGGDRTVVKQLVAEQLVTVKTRRGFSKLEWQKVRERNEALDCRVYARAAAWVIGADRWAEGKWRDLEEQVGGQMTDDRGQNEPAVNAGQVRRPFRRGRRVFQSSYLS